MAKSLAESIKREREGVLENAQALIIEQIINKLFYIEPDIKSELEMIKSQLEQKEGDRYGLHASAILASEKEFCYKEQVLSLFYKQEQGKSIPIGLKRIFEEGNYIHEKWQRLFIRGKLGSPKGMDRSRFIEEYDLSFTPDALIKIAGKKYVVEIKSVNTFQFKNLTNHPSGKKQLLFYMHLLGCENGFVLCEDKNTQEIKIFPYLLSEYHDLMDTYDKRLRNIQKYKKAFEKDPSSIMKLGICNGDKTCKRATNCNMRCACFKIGIGRIRL